MCLFALAFAIDACAAGVAPPSHHSSAESAPSVRRKARRQERLANARQRFAAARRREHDGWEALSPEERDRVLREKAEREQREHERLLVEIDSSNAGIRASAASRLEVTGEDLRQLELLLSHDPDARVRAAAAERLAFADAAAVPAMLLAALHDPDPGVVIASIEALTFVGDDSIIPDLRKMLDHADPAVRSHAQQAIDFLR